MQRCSTIFLKIAVILIGIPVLALSIFRLNWLANNPTNPDYTPGLIIIGMVPIFASMVITVFAAVLQRLLKEAVNIKSENDLMV
ncbi:MAG TPA: hypothetical protein DIC60_03760 [Lachnospiraceae bacterium]|nr:hypothetical protein [Lachnospiraceae bacterium]